MYRGESFFPPVRTLLGPGPSDVAPRTLEALARPTVGHLDPSFTALMEQIKILLRETFKTSNNLTFPVSGPGSAGMETCFVNLVEPDDEVLVCINGVFGKRMLENVERCRGIAHVLETPWGQAIDPQQVQEMLKKYPKTKIVAFVQAETSTGVLSQAKDITQVAHQAGALVIVDAVTSLGGVELLVDEWGLDAVYSGTQKCLSCIPGLSPVTFASSAVQKIKKRKSKVQSWFFDLNLVMDYWEKSDQGSRSYHHTAPVNSLYALHESLLILKEEGLENSWQRHRQNHLLLKTGLEKLGIEFLVAAQSRLPQLNSIMIPQNVDDAQFRQELLTKFNIEIGGGLGALAKKIWRVGLMGHASNEKNVTYLLHAMQSLLSCR